MHKAHRLRSLQALVVASCLWLSLSAAGSELRLTPVTLSVKQRPEVDAVRVGHLPPSQRQQQPARSQGPPLFELNAKAYLQRALDTLEPLAASTPGHSLGPSLRALRQDVQRAFFDVSRVHDAAALERSLRLSQQLRRLWLSGGGNHPEALRALDDLQRQVQQAAYAALSDARLLFAASRTPPAAAEGMVAFGEAERAWEEAARHLEQGREQEAGQQWLTAWRKALEAMSRAGVHFRPGQVTDVDGDGVPDQVEVRYGASPLLLDTDGDGLSDLYELRFGGAHLLPASADTDGDGTADGAENPDSDGWTSLEEQARGTDPLQPGPGVDRLASAPRGGPGQPQKALALTLPGTGAGTSPPSAPPMDPLDSDGDGLEDIAELANGTPPTVADWDGDGLNDYQELLHLTEPDAADTDGDGFSDHDEVTHREDGLDPLAPDERLSPEQWARDYAQALALGDTCGTALSRWQPCKGSIPFFLGQLSGGAASFIPVVGWVVGALADVRDAVGNAVKGQWAGAGLSVLGVLPVVGDVGKLVGRIVEFTTQYGKL